MSNKLLTPADVLQEIGAKDFRSISKKQLMGFVSSIPNMSKEVAIKCIEQFPEYKNHAKNMLEGLTRSFDRAVQANEISAKETIESYRSILNSLQEQLKSKDLSIQEMHEINEQMVEIADKIAAVHKNDQEFLHSLYKYPAMIALVGMLSGAAMLGVKAIKNKTTS